MCRLHFSCPVGWLRFPSPQHRWPACHAPAHVPFHPHANGGPPMSMITARYVMNAAADSRAVRVNSDSGWRSIGQGLGFVALGYAALLLGGALGALLIYEAASGRPVFGRYAL